MKRPGKTALLCLAGLALFSAAFSLAARSGIWPELPPGALHDTDLWAGFAGGGLLLFLLLARRDSVASAQDQTHRREDSESRGEV